jgi:phage terminase large subunit
MIDLKFDTTPLLEKNFDSDKRIKINRGGTRSSKTYSICQLLVWWLFTGQISKDRYIMVGYASVVRKTFPALKASAYRDIIEILHQKDLFQFVKEDKSQHTLTFENRVIEFFSADNQQKVRGRKRSILFCNEANELNYKTEFFQLLVRTTDDVFLDFNPDDINVWINTELEQRRQFDKGDVEVIVSNFTHNTFLDKTTIAEIEYLQKVDPMFWKVFGMGEYGNITGLIFPEVNIIAAVPDDAKLLGIGLDFGFTNDPSAAIELYLQDGEIILNELIYERGLTNSDISERFTDLGINQSDLIIADSAEPKSIAELQRLGWYIEGAVKGADSIKNGIDILKRYKINITAGSVNLEKERKKYKWAVDKKGNTLNKPIDFDNHLWDAARYIATKKLSLSVPSKPKTRSVGSRNKSRSFK